MTDTTLLNCFLGLVEELGYESSNEDSTLNPTYEFRIWCHDKPELAHTNKALKGEFLVKVWDRFIQLRDCSGRRSNAATIVDVADPNQYKQMVGYLKKGFFPV